MYFQMGSAAMDALKYSNYMSGLYGSMATSGTTNTDPTNTTSTGNKSPYSQMQQPQDSTATGLSPKSPYESNNGSANSNPLKSNYSADSLSRSYFDGSRYVHIGPFLSILVHFGPFRFILVHLGSFLSIIQLSYFTFQI